MSPIVIILLATFVVVVVGFVLYGAKLSPKWEVSATKLVAAEREILFDYVNNIENWERWTVWSKDVNSNFEFTYEGARIGTGATQCWKAKGHTGKTKICGGERPDQLRFMLTFGHGGHMVKGCLMFKTAGMETEVTWRMHGDSGNNPSKKIMAKMMAPIMRRDMEGSLARLKTVMEDKSRKWEH